LAAAVKKGINLCARKKSPKVLFLKPISLSSGMIA